MADPDDVLVIQQGDDRPITWTLADEAGDPINLDGYTARGQVRRRADATAVLHEWSTAAGTAVLTESSVTLKVDDSESWTWRTGVFDLHMTDPSGRTEVVLPPRPVVLTPTVTR